MTDEEVQAASKPPFIHMTTTGETKAKEAKEDLDPPQALQAREEGPGKGEGALNLTQQVEREHREDRRKATIYDDSLKTTMNPLGPSLRSPSSKALDENRPFRTNSNSTNATRRSLSLWAESKSSRLQAFLAKVKSKGGRRSQSTRKASQESIETGISTDSAQTLDSNRINVILTEKDFDSDVENKDASSRTRNASSNVESKEASSRIPNASSRTSGRGSKPRPTIRTSQARRAVSAMQAAEEEHKMRSPGNISSGAESGCATPLSEALDRTAHHIRQKSFSTLGMIG
ncbi:hypothetical protein AAMO2058_001241100 [Amorphochlora amoebiformis]